MAKVKLTKTTTSDTLVGAAKRKPMLAFQQSIEILIQTLYMITNWQGLTC